MGALHRRVFAALFFCVLAGTAQAQNPADDLDEHGTGALPTSRERLAAAPRTAIHRAFLPPRADLSSLLPRPGSQGRQGSCVGWAIGYAARAYYAGREGRDLNDDRNIPSPAFIYNTIKEAGSCDMGSSIYAGLSLLREKGARSLAEFPYSQARCSRPSTASIQAASDFRIKRFVSVNTKVPDQVKAELVKGNPVIIRLITNRAFHRLRAGQTYRTPAASTGAHAITIVGYDDSRRAFKLINSWGSKWADGGYGWIDYDIVSDPDEVTEGWVMEVEPPKPEPQPKPQPTPDLKPPVVAVVPPPAPAPPSPQPPMPIEKCERVSEVKLADGKTVYLGFVGSDERNEFYKKRADAEGNKADLIVQPWPQCEATLTLDKALQKNDGLAVGLHPTEGVTGPREHLVEGETFALQVLTPQYPSYVHVAYIQADGSVLHLAQSDATSLKVYPPASTLVFGDGAGGRPRFRVAAPFGREMVIVVAAKSPLFSEPRPARETEREFLTALRLALIAKPDPSMPDREVTAKVGGIITVAKEKP